MRLSVLLEAFPSAFVLAPFKGRNDLTSECKRIQSEALPGAITTTLASGGQGLAQLVSCKNLLTLCPAMAPLFRAVVPNGQAKLYSVFAGSRPHVDILPGRSE